ncbi:hypothetical protein [Gemmiger formicilis]|uniref:hypothetical protein n=1 Tax=Gemmiger formicilis TaxID=745368 RepID=UPI003994FB49
MSWGCYLFVDGARMAYGLTSPANDLSLQDYAALCDVFYLGGTKCGALFGEAVVITNDDLKAGFPLLPSSSTAACWPRAACWVSSFWPCWTARTAAAAACISRWRRKPTSRPCASAPPLRQKAVRLLHDSPTNQQFFVLPDEWYDKLAETYAMTHMGKPDKHHTAVRVCTSWATKDENRGAADSRRRNAVITAS